MTIEQIRAAAEQLAARNAWTLHGVHDVVLIRADKADFSMRLSAGGGHKFRRTARAERIGGDVVAKLPGEK